ncbi:MAG: hypothetical protein M3320_10085, partial [Actinomycetota bacterium]|nr:hypothetical protein [Actinomycetota bacterium]
MQRIAASVLVLLASLALAAPAGAQAPRPATPELIDRAVERGTISKAEGLRLLARALLRPNTIPGQYVSWTPWDGTFPLRRVQEEAPKLPDSAAKREIVAMLRAPQHPEDPSFNCYTESSGPLPQAIESEHFFIEYAADELFGGGLTIEDYADSLDTSWNREVEEFGYAAPPILEGTPYGKYNVRVYPLQPGLYGYVGTEGTYGGVVGDNPATPWPEDDAAATCMVLNTDYETGFEQLTVGTPRQRLDATTAHEFLHSIQFGYGALDNGPNEPDLSFSEGHATWMEDEVFDDADDNHNYLYPTFEDSMGEHDEGSVYSYWLTWRGITQRFGTGTAGAHEDIVQRFWEISGREEYTTLDAMDIALAPTGLGLAEAFHDYAIAARFLKPCGGGYAMPHCFEEADAFADVAGGRPEPHGAIEELGGTFGTPNEPAEIEDNLALNWIDLPAATEPMAVTLAPRISDSHLRMSVICDTGSGLRVVAAPNVVRGGGTVTARFDPAGCQSRPSAVITNETRRAPNPDSSTFTRYVLGVGAAPPEQPLAAPPADPIA